MRSDVMMLASCEYERIFESRKWATKIPYMRFPHDWEVKIIPPVTGAVIRFLARKNDKEISVYLDCYNNLGVQNSPYWEAYPIGEDTARFHWHDWQGLLDCMEVEFNKKEMV